MVKSRFRWSSASLLALWLAACGGGGDQGRITFDLELERLPELGPERGAYEGWAIVNGVPLSTGKFVIDASFSPAQVFDPTRTRNYGTVRKATFGPSVTGLGQLFPFIQDAAAFMVTVEPEEDEDRVPSGNVVMAGSFVGKVAELDAIGLSATGGPGIGDLSSASGRVLLATPTGTVSNLPHGIWFVLDPAGAMPSLVLPPAPGGWRYEGWVQSGTALLSTGKFTTSGGADFDAQSTRTRGPVSIGFPAPGQDFLAATAIEFATPLNLVSGAWRAVMTVEPEPDNSALPFPLVILEAPIPTDAVDALGRNARDVMLESQAALLPALEALISPASVTFTGSAPGTFNDPRGGYYAAWAVINGTPNLLGRFVVDATSQITSIDGSVIFGTTAIFVLDPSNTGLGAAFPNAAGSTELFLSQEPDGVLADSPSPVVVLAGANDFGTASLSVAGLSATGGRGIADFAHVEGSFVTVTPTDDGPGVPANDGMGIWFLRRLFGQPSLILPELPPNWRYEGWVVNSMSGERWSTGRFWRLDAPDEDAMTWPGRGASNTGFARPGQDFVVASAGRTIPAMPDLRQGWTTFVTLEPDPDNDSRPFFLRLLEGGVPISTGTPGPSLANLFSTFPRGRVSWR